MSPRRMVILLAVLVAACAIYILPSVRDSWSERTAQTRFEAVSNPSLLALGETRIFPSMRFQPWSHALQTSSAKFLDRIGRNLADNGIENFEVTINAQNIKAGALARLNGIPSALAASSDAQGWRNVPVSGFRPSRLYDWLWDFDPDRRVFTVAITRRGLPAGEAADWSKRPNGLPEDEIYGFSAGSEARVYALTDPRIDQSASGTIDFLVSLDWKRLNGYDPVALSVGDRFGPRFEVHILDKRDGLAVWDGSQDNFVSLACDFTADKVYHVALVTRAGQTTVVVDGSPLAQTLPVGYGAGAADTLTLGAGTRGDNPFTGRLGRVRLWSDALTYDQYASLSSRAQTPAIGEPLREKFVGATQFDPATKSLSWLSAPPLATPKPGWWSPAGAADVRIHNLPAFAAGREAPQFSPLQVALANAPRGGGADVSASGEAALAQDQDVFKPEFAVHELYKLVADDGIDPASFELPAATRGAVAVSIPVDINQGLGLEVRMDADGVLRVAPGLCAGIDAGRVRCPASTASVAYFALEAREYIRAVTWTQTADRHLRDLRFITNLRNSPIFAASAASSNPPAPHAIWMPPGVRPSALTVHYEGANAAHAIGVSLAPPPTVARPGVTLISDSGEATRFGRVKEDEFVSVNAELTKPGGAGPPVARKLHTLGDTRIQVDGIEQELSLAPTRAAVKPTTGFNDTFVALSKAVNLQANYVGYDILRMDPLRLAKAGTEKRIFAMPAGDSFDYYDANHVFVPNGLIYAPEYTGRNYATVHSADTYAQYRDAFSDTVSLGLSGKVLPVSFSASMRMSNARQSISESKISKTLGLSKAIFYDLALDKSRMALDPGFVTEVNELKRNGRFADFVAQFGTHYPAAVVYGGLGVLEVDVTESMRESLLEQGVGVKIETSFLLDANTQTSASIGQDHEQSHQKTFRSTVGSQVDNFYWIGGAHAGGDKSAWSVGLDGVAPVHVNLRRIEELLSPVYFDDPEIYVRVRAELAVYIDKTLADAAARLPQDASTPRYVLEVRLDKILCSVAPNSSNTKSGITVDGDAKLNSYVAKTSMFPTLAVEFISPPRLFKDFDATPEPADATASPFSFACPSDIDIIPSSTYLTNHRTARFRVTADDLKTPADNLVIYDRRDIEHVLLYPPKEALDDKNAFLEGLYAGLTLGLKVAWDEAFTPGGSRIVPHKDDAPRKPAAQLVRSVASQFLCEEINGACAAPLTAITPETLDTVVGHWFQHSHVFPGREVCGDCFNFIGLDSAEIQRHIQIMSDPQFCFYCEPHQVLYSVRVVR